MDLQKKRQTVYTIYGKRGKDKFVIAGSASIVISIEGYYFLFRAVMRDLLRDPLAWMSNNLKAI